MSTPIEDKSSLEATPKGGSRGAAGAVKKNRIWKRRCCALDWHKLEQKVPKLDALLRDGKESYCKSCFDAFQTLGLWRDYHEKFGMISTDESEQALSREFALLHEHSVKRNLLPYLKFKTSAFCAWGLDDALPAVPDIPGSPTPHLVGGTYYAFSQRMKRSVIKTKLSFFITGLMLKKGLPRPTKVDCRDAVVKAYATMTTAVKRKEGDEAKIRLVGHYLTKCIYELFDSTKIDWDHISMRWPSTSAHFDWSRKDGGALGALKEAGLMPRPQLLVIHERDDWLLPEEWILDTHLVLDETALQDAQKRLVDSALAERPTCAPQALPEPLKIRVVTAGPPLTYAALAPLQKILHRVTSRDCRFASDQTRFAIAAPLDGAQIFKALGDLRPGKKWLSGDYKAATDNLAKELSELAVNVIARVTRMPQEYHSLLMRALTGHFYTYDTSFKGERTWAPELPQLRGQLMGSPVSFPILCLVNFALIWASVFPTAKFSEVRCLVNGDDCLFQADDTEKRNWESMADAVGLTPSVGKCYYSEDFMVVNSETYLDDKGQRPANWSGFERIPFINYGLVLGLKRSGDKETSCEVDDDSTSKTIGARCRALVRDWDNYTLQGRDAKSVLVEMFLDYNAAILPSGVPLHVTENWGGLGIPETLESFGAALRRWTDPKPGAIKRHYSSDVSRLRPMIKKDIERRAKLEEDCWYSGSSPDRREVVKLKTTCVKSAHSQAQIALRRYGRRFSDVPDSITDYQWLSIDVPLEDPKPTGDELSEYWASLPEQALPLSKEEMQHYLTKSPLKRRLAVTVSFGDRDWEIRHIPWQPHDPIRAELLYGADVVSVGLRMEELYNAPADLRAFVVATTLNKSW